MISVFRGDAVWAVGAGAALAVLLGLDTAVAEGAMPAVAALAAPEAAPEGASVREGVQPEAAAPTRTSATN